MNRNNPPPETPPRNLGTTPLLYLSITKLTSILQRVVEYKKKKKKNKKKRKKWKETKHTHKLK